MRSNAETFVGGQSSLRYGCIGQLNGQYCGTMDVKQPRGKLSECILLLYMRWYIVVFVNTRRLHVICVVECLASQIPIELVVLEIYRRIRALIMLFRHDNHPTRVRIPIPTPSGNSALFGLKEG